MIKNIQRNELAENDGDDKVRAPNFCAIIRARDIVLVYNVVTRSGGMLKQKMERIAVHCHFDQALSCNAAGAALPSRDFRKNPFADTRQANRSMVLELNDQL